MGDENRKDDLGNELQATAGDVPLCVDLDGTLIQTDLLYESILLLLKDNIFNIFPLIGWLFKGKAYFKEQVAQRTHMEVSLLPYNETLIEYLKEEKAKGRYLILATASNAKYAEQIKDFTELFDEVMASDDKYNLSGSNKRNKLVERYGENGFDYAGNLVVDLKIWSHARSAIVVNAGSNLQKIVGNQYNVIKNISAKKTNILTLLKVLRIHQWVKNLLIFVPLVMAHKLSEIQLFAQAVLAFISFGLCASSAYVLNDLFDLFADRRHPGKCKRAFAAGKLSIKTGVILIPLLLVSSFFIALLLPIEFIYVLTIYYLLTVTYSLWLKNVVVVDVLVLAGLYTVRLIAGAAAVSVIPSFWLLAFSMFIFFSLALVKRYSELLAVQKSGSKSKNARAYKEIDLETLAQCGIASGFLSILVLAFYINSDAVRSLYIHPEVIWFICPLLLYWISRVWLLTRRDVMHDDPVVFAVKDGPSYLVLIICIVILWLAS